MLYFVLCQQGWAAVVLNGGDNGADTLRDVISNSSVGESVSFSGVDVIRLSSGGLTIGADNLTIGNGNGVVSIIQDSPLNNFSLFHSDVSGTGLNLRNLAIKNFYWSDGGDINGGLIGIADDSNSVKTGKFSNITFTGNNISAANYHGAGLIGVFSVDGEATVGLLENVRFANNMTTAVGGELSGGGLIGAFSVNADTKISTISGTTFSENLINVSPLIYGGGLIGTRSING